MKNVIFVDDEIDALSHILDMVSSHNVQLNYHFFKDNPDEILKFAAEQRIDIAFLDIRMPQMDGIELGERLIAINPLIKLVFISGMVQDEDALKEKFKDNFLRFLYKPFTEEELLICLSSLGEEHKVQIFTTGDGSLLIDGQPVDFVYQKSKELFFFLVSHPDRVVPMELTMEALWARKPINLAKRLYRDAVYKLRRTLVERGVGDLCTFKRGRACFNSKTADVDYLRKKSSPQDLQETFLPSYPWSLDALKDQELI